MPWASKSFTIEFALSPKASLLHAARCVSGEVVRASFQGHLVSLWAHLWDLLWRAVNDSSLRLSRKSDKKKKWQVWNANTVTCLPMSIICIRDTIISSTHTFMSGPSMNILTYFPYSRFALSRNEKQKCKPFNTELLESRKWKKINIHNVLPKIWSVQCFKCEIFGKTTYLNL